MSFLAPEPGDTPRRNGMRGLRRAALILAVVLGCADLVATAVLFAKQSSEQEERKAENCKLFVGRWRADVGQVDQTVMYLRSLSPAERAQPLNVRVAANLPTLIQRAKVEHPPNYCKLRPNEAVKAEVQLRFAAKFAKARPSPQG